MLPRASSAPHRFMILDTSVDLVTWDADAPRVAVYTNPILLIIRLLSYMKANVPSVGFDPTTS
jgi:hypothetical protein